MALGEEKAEVEASLDTKAHPYGRWSCREQEVDTLGPVSRENPARLEAEGGPASPVWGAEGLLAPGCSPGALQQQASSTSRESVAGESQPALSCLHPPAGMRTGDTLPSVGSQLEETELSASEELPQTLTAPRTAALCSGHDADTEDDPRVESPQVLDLSQQPHVSGFPFSSRWMSRVSPGTTASPELSSRSISASSPVSSLQSCQDKTEPQSCSPAKVSSSLDLVAPHLPPSVVGPGPRLHWSPQPVSSEGGAAGPGRRRLSFQAEYWACVLPDSLPPSPDRRSPLWNPNKEYEDLLDYTYPLRPGPPLSKHLGSRMLTEPVLQDSGVDLDSFSVSPASTLKSPTNVARSCPPAEATALLFSGPREPGLKRWSPGVPQKQGSVGLLSCSQLTSTPRALGSRAVPWQSREAALRSPKVWLPVGTHPEGSSPTLRTQGGGWPSSKPEREKGAGQSAPRPTCVASGWEAEEEVESEDEYLALPTRLTQVSSLVSYLGSVPTLVPLPTETAKGQSSLEVSDSEGLASLPSDSTQSRLPSMTTLPESRDPGGQNHCFLRSLVQAQDSAGEGSLVSSQALGVPSGPLRAHTCQAVLDQRVFSDPDADRQPPRRQEQGKESLVQCVKTFCCQLEDLIHWLYNVADVTNHLIPPKSSLTGLKSSLQLYRQFKKDIDEHQFLTESVLQSGEILLQCLLDNTPVLKDVLGRIAAQSGELESHADHVYDSILASLDMLAGCTLTADNKPVTAKEHQCEGL
ncbi:centrosomal protein of 68 kDa isoform X1 [Elephas maximus indicus]|uniref:centrosomal protein of 68 kDa isoform X1 n=1 Tax=Elephas maximus indicus TaxID=99487 RepID=UPI0021170A26|nr:centrosomal protein of 68 kDa isoform X1 [Elephas maximus indicus]XP_049713323.1 centrosomal protein of 68 kDa isoform X1 [Elephas maximus indicus]XP_049713324.1 centrosomal protein of 68 kDa isoform X1 [Elephas maximus indicus]XP_049713325.1 centrosomal protein of 68 kDa isoform X1 [Elephas maximus indicus]XP_049713326.1 centrosomal protein of 68 kDa isoform X1 [Elephas maximus indicus]